MLTTWWAGIWHYSLIWIFIYSASNEVLVGSSNSIWNPPFWWHNWELGCAEQFFRNRQSDDYALFSSGQTCGDVKVGRQMLMLSFCHYSHNCFTFRTSYTTDCKIMNVFEERLSDINTREVGGRHWRVAQFSLFEARWHLSDQNKQIKNQSWKNVLLW